MSLWNNSEGKALSDGEWLAIHHAAKLPERRAFANLLAELQPKRVVDLGCATGLWLDLLEPLMPEGCELIGIDSDPLSLSLAKQRSRNWTHSAEFLELDLNKEPELVPAADLTLAFNVLCYIKEIEEFLHILAARNSGGTLAVRQYDGASIRFGPMGTRLRQEIEAALRASVETTNEFFHYDMDRIFQALREAPYRSCEEGMELFARFSPFDEDFIPYYRETLDWTKQFLPPRLEEAFSSWLDGDEKADDRYFYEVDLTAILR